ncbi:MAG TPA: hypothetical protein VK866_11005 [Acidimicrobiales bacterium]|nr:hypothetical protein [Acidimicrobiales bacterium]
MQLEPAPIGWPDEAAWWSALSAFRAEHTLVGRAPVELSDFTVVGRAVRRGRPPVYVYRHRRGGVLLVDPTGQAYRWFPRRGGSGQFRTASWAAALADADLFREAVWRAGFPRGGPAPPPPPPPVPARVPAQPARGACGPRRATWSRLAGRRRGLRHR